MTRNLTAEGIALALDARPTASGWMAACPAHEDDSPSLSISEGRDGKILVHCHAGCEQQEVIDALKALALWPKANTNNGLRK